MSDYSKAESTPGIATSNTAGGAATAASGATAVGAGGMDNAELLRIMQGLLGRSQGELHDGGCPRSRAAIVWRVCECPIMGCLWALSVAILILEVQL